MSQERDYAYLVHILECIERIQDYTDNDRETFMNSSLVQDAVLRRLQTMAESTQRLSNELKMEVPEVDWRALSGFRNILVHDYLNGIDLEQHSGWIYLRNLRVLNLGDNFLYAGNAQILAEGDINIAGACYGVFYLNDSKFVNRGLTITLEAGTTCRYYWNTYASTIECWFYGDIDYVNNTGSPITGNYFALNSQYNCYADLPGFAYNGDEFTTDGCPFFGYYQNYWAMWEGGMAVMYRQGDLPPGQTEYDEQEFQIDCSFSGSLRTSGAIWLRHLPKAIAFFSDDKANAVQQQTVENFYFPDVGGFSH